MKDSISVFLLDDHKIVRDGLRSILSVRSELRIAGEESHSQRFLSALPGLTFDVLLLDVSLPDVSGMEVLKQVKKTRPEIQVVMLSMHDGPEYVSRALKAGADAYLSKDSESDVLIETILRLQEHGQAPIPELGPSTRSELVGRGESLTLKELEVLKQMVKGLSSKQIAADFNLSTRTIETHRYNIMKKLGTSNTAETIAVALRQNLVS